MNIFWEKRHAQDDYGHEEICHELKDYIANLNSNITVFDYGCGKGRVSRLLLEKKKK